jgi:hypothetical protein
MNDPGAVVAVVMTSATAGFFTIRLIVNAVMKHKELALRAEQPAGSVSDERMARLEVAVESIALEVERISEGQRFTTRLLNEAARASSPRVAAPIKQDTPH